MELRQSAPMLAFHDMELVLPGRYFPERRQELNAS